MGSAPRRVRRMDRQDRTAVMKFAMVAKTPARATVTALTAGRGTRRLM